ncbi:hypothetical protein AS159_01240 [Thermotoga sp. Ku-13t]|uniref:hypothetical protein n=1 Tax=Thermotoga sp. Ku-13t TaxID=1755813 RepID=UPI0013EC98A4|nr:hypothetical protein [Thermotoga sp. Ku-13t]KAF2958358.1 hypothetical protein AS159_01240 [Thermotoga sp. Ku-13t]
MKRAYLLNLKLYDSADARFPLDFDRVQRRKKSILTEFLSLDAAEFFMVNLFGDLALPKHVVEVLSLLPSKGKFRLKDENVPLEQFSLPSNVSLLEELPVEFTSFSSNPVETELPSFLIEEDGELLLMRASMKGCKPVQKETLSLPEEGQIAYMLEPVQEERLEQASQLQVHVLESYQLPEKETVKKLFESAPEKLKALLVEISNLQG